MRVLCIILILRLNLSYLGGPQSQINGTRNEANVSYCHIKTGRKRYYVNALHTTIVKLKVRRDCGAVVSMRVGMSCDLWQAERSEPLRTYRIQSLLSEHKAVDKLQ